MYSQRGTAASARNTAPFEEMGKDGFAKASIASMDAAARSTSRQLRKSCAQRRRFESDASAARMPPRGALCRRSKAECARNAEVESAAFASDNGHLRHEHNLERRVQSVLVSTQLTTS